LKQIKIPSVLNMSWVRHVAHLGEMKNAYKIFLGKPEGKRPLRRPRNRWEDSIRMGLREIGMGRCGLDSPGSV
jgi:hypothetical protein